jgi:hypothetical protein
MVPFMSQEKSSGIGKYIISIKGRLAMKPNLIRKYLLSFANF